MRTVALISETAVFAYMGLSLPTLHHTFHFGFIMSTMFLILVGRALNIFPLAGTHFTCFTCVASTSSLSAERVPSSLSQVM